MKRQANVYVTRNSYYHTVYVFPHRVGIRKFRGCTQWGAAWCKKHATTWLSNRRTKSAECLSPHECRERYGFYPGEGTAWLVKFDAKGKMKKSKVDIAFSP